MDTQTLAASRPNNPAHVSHGTSDHSFAPSQVNSRDYRNALGKFATGVTIVTTSSAIGPIGITANSFSSVSLDPALVLWSMSKKSERYASFGDATEFAIHVLAEEQHELALAFARSAQAFSQCDWRENSNGTPVITDALVCFECLRQSVHDAGDHVIIVGTVKQVTLAPGNPLVFAGGSFGSFISGA